jgi:hypothetical protein
MRHKARTLRLTAEQLVAASRCKHDYLDAWERGFRGNWGDSGGTLTALQRRSRHPGRKGGGLSGGGGFNVLTLLTFSKARLVDWNSARLLTFRRP